MMGLKAFMLIALAILLVIISEVAARELADSKASSDTPTNDPKFIGGLPGYRADFGGYLGGGYGGYRGGEYGGYPGGGYGGYPGGGYGGYPGGGRRYYGGYPRGGYGGYPRDGGYGGYPRDGGYGGWPRN